MARVSSLIERLTSPTYDVRVALAKKSLVAILLLLASCASMPAGAASRYALGASGVGAARPAPAASLISACVG